MAMLLLTTAQAAVVADALADAELYRRNLAAAWCSDCATASDGACSWHSAFLASAIAYRGLATELSVALLKSAGRDVPAPRPALDQSRIGQERT